MISKALIYDLGWISVIISGLVLSYFIDKVLYERFKRIKENER